MTKKNARHLAGLTADDMMVMVARATLLNLPPRELLLANGHHLTVRRRQPQRYYVLRSVLD
jgi:hypothetical protein